MIATQPTLAAIAGMSMGPPIAYPAAPITEPTTVPTEKRP
jgi:hypothetical protein